jgi:hypothetical protein
MRGAYLNVYRDGGRAALWLRVIPVDGLIAGGDYGHEFTLHQFTDSARRGRAKIQDHAIRQDQDRVNQDKARN